MQSDSVLIRTVSSDCGLCDLFEDPLWKLGIIFLNDFLSLWCCERDELAGKIPHQGEHLRDEVIQHHRAAWMKSDQPPGGAGSPVARSTFSVFVCSFTCLLNCSKHTTANGFARRLRKSQQRSWHLTQDVSCLILEHLSEILFHLEWSTLSLKQLQSDSYRYVQALAVLSEYATEAHQCSLYMGTLSVG